MRLGHDPISVGLEALDLILFAGFQIPVRIAAHNRVAVDLYPADAAVQVLVIEVGDVHGDLGVRLPDVLV